MKIEDLRISLRSVIFRIFFIMDPLKADLNYSIVSGILEFFGQIVIDYVHADFFGTLLHITIFFTQVVNQIAHIVPDSLVVGFEIFRSIILDCPPEIFIFKKGIKHFLFQVINISFLQGSYMTPTKTSPFSAYAIDIQK